MRLPFRLFLIAFTAMITAGPAIADEILSLKVGYMLLTSSGTVSSTVAGVPGTKADIGADLNLGDSNNVTAEAAVQLGDFRLSAAYLPLQFDGSSVVTGLKFGGKTFNGSVNSTLKANLLDASLTYYLINMDDMPSRFQLGPELSIKTVDAEASITDNLLGFTQTATATVPIPTIGARGRVALADFVGVTGRVGYIGYAGNRFLDAEAQVEFSPFPLVGIYAGYRYLEIKADEAGVFMDVQFSGPFAGALVRF